MKIQLTRFHLPTHPVRYKNKKGIPGRPTMENKKSCLPARFVSLSLEERGLLVFWQTQLTHRFLMTTLLCWLPISHLLFLSHQLVGTRQRRLCWRQVDTHLSMKYQQECDLISVLLRSTNIFMLNNLLIVHISICFEPLNDFLNLWLVLIDPP